MQAFRAVTIIPARGGSQGLKRKNVLPFAGKPLIAHSIGQSLACKLIQHTFVSTDDDEIAEISSAAGAGVIRRPRDISSVSASSEMALSHALAEISERQACKLDYVVFLQCTSPLRTGTDIAEALHKIHSEGKDSLLSVSPDHRFIWQANGTGITSINYDYRLRPRRQDMIQQYVENGSIYIFKPEILGRFRNRLGGKIACHVMQSWQAFEIDDFDDFQLCEWLFQRYLAEPGVEHGHQQVRVIAVDDTAVLSEQFQKKG